MMSAPTAQAAAAPAVMPMSPVAQAAATPTAQAVAAPAVMPMAPVAQAVATPTAQAVAAPAFMPMAPVAQAAATPTAQAVAAPAVMPMAQVAQAVATPTAQAVAATAVMPMAPVAQAVETPTALAVAAPAVMPMAPVAQAVVTPTAQGMAAPAIMPMAPVAQAVAAPTAQAVAAPPYAGHLQQPQAMVPMAMATAAAAGMVTCVAQGLPVAGSNEKSGGACMQPPVAGTPVAAGVPLQSAQPRVELPGKRKSLLIGINYFGTSSELHGCIADVKRMRPLLEQQGFPSDEGHQMVLLDEAGMDSMRRPTLYNMRKAIQWLTSDAQTGDALFFHYSGHGGREENPNAASGYVETLCPEDCDKEGMLLDTELFEILVRPLPSGCRLTCLMDCCHSGGVLNLPYLFTGTQENLRQAFSGRAMNMAMSKDWLYNISALQRGNPMAFLEDVSSMGLGLWGLWKQQKTSKDADSNGFVADEQENVGLAVGEVVAITGCRSDQTSADVGNVHEDFQIAGRRASVQMGHRRSMPNTAAGGALTSVFMESLQAAQGISYLELLERIRGRLEEEDFEQVPQLATSLLIELNQPFSLTTISLPAKPNTKAQQQQQPGPGGRNLPGGLGAATAVGGLGVLGGMGAAGAMGGGGMSGMGAMGAGALGGAAAGAGASALLAGFMASMMTGRGPGQQMLQSATVPGGGMPYANMMSGMSSRGMGDGGSFGANNFFHALQEDSDDDDWWEAATGHVRRMSSVKHTEIHNYTEINQTVEQHNDNSMNFSPPEETVNEVENATADVEDPVEDEPHEPEENEDEPDEPEENEDEPDEPEENEDEPDEPEENEDEPDEPEENEDEPDAADEPEEDEPDEVEEDEDEPDEPEDSEPEEEEDEPEEDEDFDDDDDDD